MIVLILFIASPEISIYCVGQLTHTLNTLWVQIVQLQNVLCSQLHRAWGQYGGRVLLWWSVPERKWGELFSRGCDGR